MEQKHKYTTLINDENVKSSKILNKDNSDKVNVQKNMIEEMEKKINLLNEEKKKYKHTKKYIPVFLYASLGASLVLPPLIMWILGIDIPTTYVEPFLGPISEGVFMSTISTIFFSCIGLQHEINNHSIYIKDIKKVKDINRQLEFLGFEVEKEKEILKKLQLGKNQDCIVMDNKAKHFGNSQKIRDLDIYLELCQMLGYDEKKYFEYYLQGKLDEILKKYKETKFEQDSEKQFEQSNFPKIRIKKRV